MITKTSANLNKPTHSVIADVDKAYDSKPKKIKVELTCEGKVVGDIELTISYHKYSIADIMGMRGRWFLEWPVAKANAIRSLFVSVGKSVPGLVRSVLHNGLPGLHGGAGALGVLWCGGGDSMVVVVVVVDVVVLLLLWLLLLSAMVVQ
jgi:hypothetical protein